MKLFKKLSLLFAALALTITIAACDLEGDEDWDTEYTSLTIARGDWPSAEFHSHVAKFIVENGWETFDVEISTLATAPMLVSLRAGEVDFHMEMWTENMASYQDDLAEGLYEEVSVNFADNAQGIYIPEYVATEYGIETIQDLVEYKHLFPDPDVSNWDPDHDKAVLWGGPSDWEITEFLMRKFENTEEYGDLIDAFEFRPLESTAMLNAQLVANYENEEPWVGYHWEPSYIMGTLDMVLLGDDLPYDMETGAGNPPAQPVTIAARSGLDEDHPEIYSFLSNYQTSAAITSEAEAYMTDNDLSAEEAAQWWLLNHPELWEDWVPSEVFDNVMDALEE